MEKDISKNNHEKPKNQKGPEPTSEVDETLEEKQTEEGIRIIKGPIIGIISPKY
jgi:hypothetical protein